MFLPHDVEPASDRRVDSDREVVVDDGVRNLVSLAMVLFSAVLVLVWVLAMVRWRTELDLPSVHHQDLTLTHPVQDLAQALTLVPFNVRYD